jgi:hypothetical protein
MSTQYEWPILGPTELEGMAVCGDCGDAVGPVPGWGGAIQRGPCPVHAHTDGDPRWTRGDYERGVQLCQCCGTVALASGSKFSVWFCATCKQRVLQLNRAHGRCILPLGRHSVHAGFLLPGAEASNPVSVHCFLTAVNSLNEPRQLTSEWGRLVVPMNLQELGLDASSVVSAGQYVELAGGIDKDRRFLEMFDFLRNRAQEVSRQRELS